MNNYIVIKVYLPHDTVKAEVESVVWDHTKNVYPFPFSQIRSSLLHQGEDSWWCETLPQLNFTEIFFPGSLMACLYCETHNSCSLPHKFNFEHKAVPLISVKLNITLFCLWWSFWYQLHGVTCLKINTKC